MHSIKMCCLSIRMTFSIKKTIIFIFKIRSSGSHRMQVRLFRMIVKRCVSVISLTYLDDNGRFPDMWNRSGWMVLNWRVSLLTRATYHFIEIKFERVCYIMLAVGHWKVFALENGYSRRRFLLSHCVFTQIAEGIYRPR